MNQGRLGLKDFIKQVKREILEYETEQEGALALFELEGIELEAKVMVSATGNGKFSLYVAEAGADLNSEYVQTVKIRIAPILDRENSPHNGELSERPRVGGAGGRGPRFGWWRT